MPELPEVETIRRGIAPAVEGQLIADIAVRRPDLRVPFPAGLAASLRGERVLYCQRRAKYLVLACSGERNLVIHLGMSGRLGLYSSDKPYKPAKHDHLIIHFENGMRLVLNDPRRFGMVLLIPGAELETHPAFANMGPEPLGNSFNPAYLATALNDKKTTIKAALLDQRIVAGLGNIYVCEALFYAGIDPQRLSHTLKMSEIEALVPVIREVLDRALEAGGSTLKDYRQADGGTGYFQHSFAVYGQVGKACPGCDCDVSNTGGIMRISQSGRSTFFCPRKQN